MDFPNHPYPFEYLRQYQSVFLSHQKLVQLMEVFFSRKSFICALIWFHQPGSFIIACLLSWITATDSLSKTWVASLNVSGPISGLKLYPWKTPSSFFLITRLLFTTCSLFFYWYIKLWNHSFCSIVCFFLMYKFFII